jgi:hypothetical protein
MPAARNRIFTLVAEFLALQAICQCPRLVFHVLVSPCVYKDYFLASHLL